LAGNFKILIGVNQTQAPKQFKINPKLQRTRAGEPSVRQGFTLGTFEPSFPIEKGDLIRLPNRAVPQNTNFVESPRVLQRDFIAFVDVPNPPAETKPNTGAGITNTRRNRKTIQNNVLVNSRLVDLREVKE